jgi:hypothetical protein
MRALRLAFLPSLLLAADAKLAPSPQQRLSFEPNLGQTDAHVRFLARGPGYMAWITDHELVIRPGSASPTRLEFARPSGSPRSAKGLDQRSGLSSYFIGEDESKWVRNVPSYAKALVEDVYPGIDIVFYEGKKAMEYDFIVKPGADPSQISIRFDPDSKPVKEANGDITWDGYRHSVPKVYQGSRTIAHGVGFVENELRFEIAKYDTARELVIDPVVDLEFFRVNASSDDHGTGVATDPSGGVYVTGSTRSPNFPLRNGRMIYTDPISTFVTKLAPSTSSIEYSIFIGSATGSVGVSKIAVDRFGSAYVGVSITGTGFPVRLAYQSASKGGSEVYVAKIGTSPAFGYDLIYGTYLGGLADDYLRAIAVDENGNAYLTGETSSPDFPIVDAMRQVNRGANEGFAAMIQAAPSTDGSLQPVGFSMTFGGSLFDEPNCIAIDPFGAVYIGGRTSSNDFPIRRAHRAQRARVQGIQYDNFAIKIAKPNSTTPHDMEYSTFIGGAAVPELSGSGLVADVGGIAVDSSGALYVTGTAQYSKLAPLRAFDTAGPGYLLKIASTPRQGVYPLEISSHLPLRAKSIHLDRFGSVYLTGITSFELVSFQEDTYFPLLDSDVVPAGAGLYTAALKLSATGTGPLQVQYGTIVTGSGYDLATALDLSGNLFVVITIPTYPGPPQSRELWAAKVGNAPSANRVIVQSNLPGMRFSTSGSGCNAGEHVAPKGFNWARGTQCTISFVSELPRDTSNNPPKVKWLFGHWANTEEKSPSRTITVTDSPVNYTAIYESAGLVEVSIPLFGGLGTFEYPGGVYIRKDTLVLIIAKPQPGYVFSHWSGESGGKLQTLRSSERALMLSDGGLIRLDAYFAPEIRSTSKLQFIPLTPCRVLDTRTGSMTLAAKTDRDIAMRGVCGIPQDAQAYSLNVTVVPKGPLGYLTMYPSGGARPTVSLLNSLDGRVKANATILPAGTNGGITAYGTDATELIVDVNGLLPGGSMPRARHTNGTARPRVASAGDENDSHHRLFLRSSGRCQSLRAERHRGSENQVRLSTAESHRLATFEYIHVERPYRHGGREYGDCPSQFVRIGGRLCHRRYRVDPGRQRVLRRPRRTWRAPLFPDHAMQRCGHQNSRAGIFPSRRWNSPHPVQLLRGQKLRMPRADKPRDQGLLRERDRLAAKRESARDTLACLRLANPLQFF